MPYLTIFCTFLGSSWHNSEWFIETLWTGRNIRYKMTAAYEIPIIRVRGQSPPLVDPQIRGNRYICERYLNWGRCRRPCIKTRALELSWKPVTGIQTNCTQANVNRSDGEPRTLHHRSYHCHQQIHWNFLIMIWPWKQCEKALYHRPVLQWRHLSCWVWHGLAVLCQNLLTNEAGYMQKQIGDRYLSALFHWNAPRQVCQEVNTLTVHSSKEEK